MNKKICCQLTYCNVVQFKGLALLCQHLIFGQEMSCVKLLFICRSSAKSNMITLIWKLGYFYLDFSSRIPLVINGNLGESSKHRVSIIACDSHDLPHLLLYHYKVPLSQIYSSNFLYALSALLIRDFQYGLL